MFSLSSLALHRTPIIFRRQFTVSDASSPAIPPSQNSILTSSKLNLRFPTFMSNFQFSGIKSSTEAIVDEDDDSSSSKRREKASILRVGLICGGPSMERGISLNSARSVLDHIQIQGDDLRVSCYYIDSELNAYAISSAQDNCLAYLSIFIQLFLAQGFRCLSEFVEHLAASVDIVFPVIHGPFGEDGTLQYEASLELSRQGFLTVPSFLVQGNNSDETDLQKWFETNQLDVQTGKVVVKPARGGSSIGVTVAYGVADSFTKACQIITDKVDDKALVETFLEGGKEFTAIVLDVGIGSDRSPVVLLPTEVELQFQGDANLREKDAIFNYRRKYLPTQQVAYHTPPHFPLDAIEMIREGASLLFQRLGLCDFARIDGWYLPPSSLKLSPGSKFGRSESGLVLFTDINLLEVTPCFLAPTSSFHLQSEKDDDLRSRSVWFLPYSLLLRHTTEEVLAACIEAMNRDRAALTSRLRKKVMDDLMIGLKKHSWFTGFDISDEVPVMYSLLDWVRLAKDLLATVFIAVHGGIGEDGTLQSLLEVETIPYTGMMNIGIWDLNVELNFIGLIILLLIADDMQGPGVMASKICMDKVATSLALKHLAEYGVLRLLTIDKEVRRNQDLLQLPVDDIWQELTMKLKCESLCVKPARDGCSTGVARLRENALEKCKQRVELVANALQLEGFSRIDAFVNVDTGEVLVIEVNTVPGMTPSTVLIHQVEK
uniref:ATP-grasp domain-containing protein n=1 Tax=Chenopodium quinoa TaxID=63459 RepID=A0A803MB92_CHEQI